MELEQLRCFLAAADELHFGRAAQRRDMLPAAFGRTIRLLEQTLGTQLFHRTTRSVALTAQGTELVSAARRLIDEADGIAARFSNLGRDRAETLRIGAIDTAAAGLLPLLLNDFRAARPHVRTEIVEDKSYRLLPRLRSGRIDIAFLRPPEQRDRSITIRPLFSETAVVAVPTDHPLASQREVSVADLENAPLIVPDRRSRPHSHDLTIKLFAEAGVPVRIGQFATEKQTIVTLVAAGLGIAIVPRWTAQLAVAGVCYLDLATATDGAASRLPLAVAYPAGGRDGLRDTVLEMLSANLERYAALA